MPGHNSTAFTIKSTVGIQRVLVTSVIIINPVTNNSLQIKAIWDTGASGSVISKNVSSSLGLIPTGKAYVNTANGVAHQNTFTSKIVLPNNVNISDVSVTEVDALSEGCDALIGMDIITLGDFSITNYKGSTCMSFRFPSLHEIDYVANLNMGVTHISNPPSSFNNYAGTPRNSLCPCGSGLKYKRCHFKES